MLIDDLAQLRAHVVAFWASQRTEEPRVDEGGSTLRIHRHPTLPTYECLVRVGEAQGLALLDTGATASFMTPEMASASNAIVDDTPQALHASFLQGKSSPITQRATADVHIREHLITARHRFYITSMASHDVLLGMDWIESARPEPNYSLRTWDLRLPVTVEIPTNDATRPSYVDLTQVVSSRQNPRQLDDLLTVEEPHELPAFMQARAAAISPLPTEYEEYADVFDTERANQLPPHRPHDHEIHLEAGKTIPFGALYSLSHREQEELREYLAKMEANGFIRPSKSPAAAPLLFVPKKDGSLRPCVDYRALNAITVKDRYPIPLINEHLDRLSSAKVFTKLDLKGAYNLLRIAEGHEWKTAFRTRYGSYEYLVMPFGLCNAPSTFQRLMNYVLADLLDVFVIVYLDDILVYSESTEEHVGHVRQVLERLRTNQLYCAPDKCEFHVTSVEFLGYVVTTNGVTMDESKVRTVVDWPQPESIRQIQVFLGFANFYRRFIRHYSRVVSPLTDLLKGVSKGRVELPPAAVDAFNRLKKEFTTAPILRHFDPTLPTVIETDASDAVVAAVLSQWHQRNPTELEPSSPPNTRTHSLHPVAYWSRKMIPAERNYEIHDKELLAIVDCCAQWRHYLHGLGKPFLVYTDHQALLYFNTKRQLTRRQARWQAELAEFDLVIHYRPGKEAVRPDALSRRHDLFPDAPSKPDPANYGVLLPDHFFAAAAHVEQPLDGLPPAWVEELKATTSLPDAVTWIDGLPRHQNGKIFLPNGLRHKALQLLHDHPTSGHAGPRPTLSLVRRHFWWPSLTRDVHTYVRTCAACRRAKPPRHKPHGYLLPSSPPNRPWSRITMDHVTELPPSVANGHTYDAILVVVDKLTKYAVFIPANSADTAATLAHQLHRYVFAYFGLPDDIVSDRGTTFVAEIWVELLRILRITGSFSSAHHPQTDGQTERTNQSLETFLRFYTAYDHSDWASLLPTAQLALNNRPSSTTTVSPFTATLTFAPRIHPTLPPPSADGRTPAELLAICQEGIQRANQAMAGAYNRRRSDVKFSPGEKVLLRTRNLRGDRPSRKLSNPLAGPFRVEARVGALAYRLRLPASWKIHPVFHVQMLEPYPDDIRESTDAPQSKTLVDDYEDFEVEEIRDSRRRKNRLHYLVKWVGYKPSWVPADDVDHATELVDAFHAANPDKPRPRK